MSRKPPIAAMIPRASLRIDFIAPPSSSAFPVEAGDQRFRLFLRFFEALLDERSVVLVAGKGLQFGEELGYFAGDGDGGIALLLGSPFGACVGELFRLVLGGSAESTRHEPRVGRLC